MSDTLRTTFRRVLRLENRRAAPRPGRIEKIDAFTSTVRGNTRELTIYLPPGYDDRSDRRYPVLYMHDGQNLFEAHRSFVPGQYWRVQEAADAAIAERAASPMIIVGIDHAGPARIDEYTPTRDAKHNGGGLAHEHAKMLIEEIKPMIDERYRTLGDREHTAVAGSSLGGLDTMWLALKHPEVFGGAAVMSPSVWWDGQVILREVEAFSGEKPRVWLDIGGREGNEAMQGARALRKSLAAKGWDEERLSYYEDRRADHSERAWASRIRLPLEFLFPPS
ncbi:MAG TPA: alpha/beta hydrolase-fold protein [Thermoanaerobaculia bacterium]|nr:alpha/beta hydrolase-fold protein [Thermoanaerobaculia bacterium]